jgi:hypothetical protein
MPARAAPCSPVALLHHLGAELFAEPRAVAGGIAVAHAGLLAGLPVWTSRGCAKETLQRARRLARAGQVGLVVGHDEAAAQWQLAVSIPPVRLAAAAAGDRDALVIRRVRRLLRVPRATMLEQAIALASALDVDAAGRQTFRILHQLLDRAVALLPSTISADDRHAWALAQMTRLLFLRFVESEGWLDGNPRFLAAAIDRCLAARRDPTRHLLQPLFFGTLNRCAADRSRFARAFGVVPFLNGGLFEPHAIERRHALRLPASYWEDAFALLIDRVDVTLDDAPEDGRVTPELLGRVFEGVMPPGERAEQGTFFTPPALVAAILRETIACHLAPKLGRTETAIGEALDDPDPVLRRRLLDINVLDPAVGSGAFLVGALGLLHGPGPRELARVRHLVTRRLHGVDRHPGAVRVCELRLWLEVLRAIRGQPAHRIPPLPNLDAQVRAGDALLDPLRSAVLARGPSRLLQQRQRAILGAHGGDKRAAIREARRAERSALLDAMRAHEAAIEHDIAQLLAAARAPTLFGDRPRIAPALQRTLRARRQERLDLRAERRRLLRDAAATPFALRAAFAPVLAARGGFDLVVGNPPWVRAERLPPATRDALAARYRWWRSGSEAGWHHLPDLAVAFMERAFTLLSPQGTMALLVPAKIATAGYAATCRAALTHRATIHRVANLLDDPRAGFEATTYPLAIIATRTSPPAGHHVRIGLGADDPAQPQQAWLGSRSWSTALPEAQRLAARLAARHPALRESVRPQLGVKTGANVAFLNPPAALAEWTRPAVRGRDLRPFAITPGSTLLWPANPRGVPWARLPDAVAQHLEQHAHRLRARVDQHGGPWWQLFRTGPATAPHRVVWRDLAAELQAAVIDDEATVPMNSCYVAAMPSRAAADALAAWLNATPIRAIARLSAEPAAGGCARFAARTVGAVPLPAAALASTVLSVLGRAARERDIQDQLDDEVTELLGLSRAEAELLSAVAAHRR